jgi:hypothetical protein
VPGDRRTRRLSLERGLYDGWLNILMPAITTMTLLRFVPFFFVLVLLMSQSSSAQAQFERQVRAQLDKVGQNLATQGYELTTQIYTGTLDQNGREQVSVRLRAGVRYALVGVCDSDCDDLDLVLMDTRGRELASDVEQDDVPVVEVQPDRDGEYAAYAVMASCKANPCHYGLGLFATSVDPFERQVREQLMAAATRLRADGYELTHHIHTGELAQAQEEDTTAELDRGRTYVVLGVCDADCTDLDLRLLDASRKEIDRDVEVDDNPAVAVAPLRSESYTVRAIMASCKKAPCRYGFGIFAR